MATPTNTSSENGNAQASNSGGSGRSGRVAELREIPLSQITVAEGFNPRGVVSEDSELEALAQTMRERGCLQPIRVRRSEAGGYVLIAGERRYRAAALAALTQIPAAVIAAGTGQEGEHLDLLTEAMIENELRSDLNPLQRARGYRAMLDGGLSVRGVAERLGGRSRRASREQRIREHLAILVLPEDLQKLVAQERMPLLAVKAVTELCAIHEDLGRSAVSAVLGAGEDGERYTWAEVVREPLAIAVNNLEELPPGLFNTAASYPLERFSLGEKARKNLAAYERLTGGVVSSMRFTRELREQARLLGAVHECGWSAIIAGQDVGDRLAEDYIAAILTDTRARRRDEAKQQAGPETLGSSRAGAGADGERVGQESSQDREARLAEEARAERDAQRAREAQAVAYNLELGMLAFKHLTRVKVDERVLRILASVDVGGSLRGIAARGARLALPGWVSQTQRANHTTKTAYLDDAGATSRAAEFLEGARSAAEVAGRTLTLLALASLADENAIAASRRSYYSLSFRGPWADQARGDLDAIVRERIKQGQLPALDAILTQRLGKHADAAQAQHASPVTGDMCAGDPRDECEAPERAAVL